MSPPEEEVETAEKGKKQKPPNLDIPGGPTAATGETQDGLSPGSATGSTSGSATGSIAPKSPRSVGDCPDTPVSVSGPKPPSSPAASSVETAPRSPRPTAVADSPKRFPDSPIHSGSRSKQEQLQERHLERRGHSHDAHHGRGSGSGSGSGEHRHLAKSDSTVSHHRKHSTDSEDEHHHHHHHHHRSPKRTMSERRRSQRSSSTSGNHHEHRRPSAATVTGTGGTGGTGSRRSSMRMSDRRKSSLHDHGPNRRMSIMSTSDGAKSNGSPVHIEYCKKPSHPTGPYMSPYLSSAYKTPAAEILIASLIIIVGLVALIVSWATGIRVWMVVGGVCIGLGAMFMLLGLCWYCALARQKQENEDMELKVLNSKQLLKLARTPSNASQTTPQMV